MPLIPALRGQRQGPEVSRTMSSRPIWFTERASGQPELYRNPVSKRKKQTNKSLKALKIVSFSLGRYAALSEKHVWTHIHSFIHPFTALAKKKKCLASAGHCSFVNANDMISKYIRNCNPLGQWECSSSVTPVV